MLAPDPRNREAEFIILLLFWCSVMFVALRIQHEVYKLHKREMRAIQESSR